MSNGLDYEVLPPNESFKGKTYVEWIQDWSNWFYQANLDRNNDGDVIFLRSMPLGHGNNPNDPLVMVGDDSLEITEDHWVLVPIITSTYIANEGESPEWMYSMVRDTISTGDNPPTTSQLKINGKDIEIFLEKKVKTEKDSAQGADKVLEVETKKIPQTDFGAFEFETPIHTIHIPDSSAGPSLKSQVEMPIETPGYYPAVTRGFFVMLKLHKNKSYNIYCRATGAKTTYGPYHVSLFYHLKVKEETTEKTKKGRTVPPDRLMKKIANIVIDKFKKGHLNETEFKEIMNNLGIDEQTVIDIITETGGKPPKL